MDRRQMMVLYWDNNLKLFTWAESKVLWMEFILWITGIFVKIRQEYFKLCVGEEDRGWGENFWDNKSENFMKNTLRHQLCFNSYDDSPNQSMSHYLSLEKPFLPSLSTLCWLYDNTNDAIIFENVKK